MKNELPIYLDNMASTPVDPIVAKSMIPYLLDHNLAGNPHSTHAYGEQAMKSIVQAKGQIAKTINAKSIEEIIFTSGATESNNLAILGAAEFYRVKGKHIISCMTEHKSVLEPLEHLQQKGFSITYLKPQTDGIIDIEELKQAITAETILISIMHVNNEIGVIQPIAQIGKIAKKHGVLLHVDAAQSIGKLPVDVQELGVNLLSLSSHKMYGPQGIGALYISSEPKVRLKPIIHGGGQQRGRRVGTLSTHLCVGMGKACALAYEQLDNDMQHIEELNEVFYEKLNKTPGIVIHGNKKDRVKNNINFSAEGVDGESLLCAIRDLAVSTASACVTMTQEGSYVLRALGLSDSLTQSAIRISFGRFTTIKEVETASELLVAQIKRLRLMTGREITK